MPAPTNQLDGAMMTDEQILAEARFHFDADAVGWTPVIAFARALIAATLYELLAAAPAAIDKQEGLTEVGFITHSDLHGWHFAPTVAWTWMGKGRALYAAPPVKEASKPAAIEDDDPRIIAASNRGYAAGLKDGKALGACGPLAPSVAQDEIARIRYEALRDAENICRLFDLGTPDGHAIADDIRKLAEAELARAASPSANVAQDYCAIHCKKFCQNSVHGMCDGPPEVNVTQEQSVDLPPRVIDKLYQAAGVSTYHPDGDQQKKLHEFARNVVAETLARLPTADVAQGAEAVRRCRFVRETGNAGEEIERCATCGVYIGGDCAVPPAQTAITEIAEGMLMPVELGVCYWCRKVSNWNKLSWGLCSGCGDLTAAQSASGGEA